MSGNDEKTRWKFLWKQIYDRYLQKPLAPSIYNPQTDPMYVLLWYLRFSMISIKALWIKKWLGGRDKWNARVGVKPYDNLVEKNV